MSGSCQTNVSALPKPCRAGNSSIDVISAGESEDLRESEWELTPGEVAPGQAITHLCPRSPAFRWETRRPGTHRILSLRKLHEGIASYNLRELQYDEPKCYCLIKIKCRQPGIADAAGCCRRFRIR